MHTYTCSKCGTQLKSDTALRQRTCKVMGCIGRLRQGYGNRYDRMKFDDVVSGKKKPKVTLVLITGRSHSAPPISLCGKLLSYTPPGVKYVHSLSDPAWNTGLMKIRLAYQSLLVSLMGMQGLVIDPTGLNTSDTRLKAHFDAIATFMAANQKKADATEGTGEAAAAWAVGQNYPSYTMVWGFAQHSGAGIDQIWKKQTNGVTTDYLIVEAKGVGQSTSTDIFQPPKVGTQMSLEWIVDRLARMSDPLGAKVLQRCGLTPYVQWPYYGGGSKSYYGATHNASNQKVKLHGVVAAATWNAGPKLGYAISNQTTYL